MPKIKFWLYLLTGVSYTPRVNASELHFECFFQGNPTWPCLKQAAKMQKKQISKYLANFAIWLRAINKCMHPVNDHYAETLYNWMCSV